MSQIFDWPVALRPATVEWGLVVPQLLGRSSFDGSVQAQMMGAPRWVFSISTGARTRAEAAAWEAHVLRLRGMVNRVRCWDWRREAPLGPATGTPVVRLAGTGASLATEGWTPGVTGILQAGSYLGINGELKLLTETISSDALGRATVQIEPPLRAQAPAGAPLILAKPTATFVLVTDRPSMRQEGALARGASYSFEEDLRP